MSTPQIDKYVQAFFQTLLMVGISAFIAIALGLVLAVVLTVTAPRNLYPRPRFHRALSIAVNVCRAIPFIILLIALLPVTRFLVGTTLGTWAAVVPLAANLIPFLRASRRSASTTSTRAWSRPRAPWAAGAGTSCATCCCPRRCPGSSAA